MSGNELLKTDVLLSRGIENVYPSVDFLRAKLEKGESLKIFFGIDPTGPTLHLGHIIPLKKLRDFQLAGHEVILLIGDFTAMIGDPSGKSDARKPLTREQVLENASLYKKQASVFLRFDGENSAKIVYNSSWLSKMTFEDVLGLTSRVTVSQMAERDMFQERMAAGRPIFLNEFLYPLMQGYDSVFLGVDGEIGGNDQTFNMLMGRELLKEMANKEKFVLSMKLLTDNSGKKMGKTEGNMLSLIDDHFEMYGKIMSWSDGLILSGMELCTDMPNSDIDEARRKIESGGNPMEQKQQLAREVVSLLHDREKAEEAEKNFIATFRDGFIPENISEVEVLSGAFLKDILLEQKVVSSGAEFRRLINEGAIRMDDEKVSDSMLVLVRPAVIRVGKTRFLRVVVRD